MSVHFLPTPTNLLKPAIRVLGIAESTPTASMKTVLAGVVMRADFIIDGLNWNTATIGGLDASDAVIELVTEIKRSDLAAVMLHGCIIAGYNIVNLSRVHDATNLPVISITKKPQEDLKELLKAKFQEDWQERWKVIQHNGKVWQMTLPTGTAIHMQCIGTDKVNSKSLVKRLTRFGGIPEPIRVARLFARILAKKAKFP